LGYFSLNPHKPEYNASSGIGILVTIDKRISDMKLPLFALLIGFGLTVADVSSVNAQNPAPNPVVVELFTSQGCYSCPPAEAYLGELSKIPNIVALEFHVDYWDELVYGAAGKWKDVFSKPEFTERQRGYAGNLPGGQVYTPQIVVDGKKFTVGSHRRKVEGLISEARKAGKMAGKTSLSVTVSNHSQQGYVATINGPRGDRAQSVWLVRFLRNVTTRVRSGENKGKTLTSHNIVTKVERLSGWPNTTTIGNQNKINFLTSGLERKEGCAVIIQEDGQGPIHAAALCPPQKNGDT